MSAVSKALSFVSGPPLLLVLLVVTAGPGEALISKQEEADCWVDWQGCKSNCGEKAKECGAQESTCYKDCKTVCDYKQSDCLRDADKDAPKPIRPLPKKDLPELQPEGAKPKAPKGDIQQQ